MRQKQLDTSSFHVSGYLCLHAFSDANYSDVRNKGCFLFKAASFETDLVLSVKKTQTKTKKHALKQLEMRQ